MPDQIQSPAEWTSAAAPGACTTYFVGCLPEGKRDSKDVAHAAGEWLRLSELGLIQLTQRRIGDNDSNRFAYIATRKNSSTSPPPPARRIREAMSTGRAIVDTMIAIS